MAPANTQFSIAVHILTGMANVGKVNSLSLAGSVNASPIFLKRTLAKLAKAGLVKTKPGRTGGAFLARPANKITLLDVYAAVEFPKAFAVHEYPKVASCNVSCRIQETMTGVLDGVQEAIEKKLKAQTIADLLAEIKSAP